MEISKNTDIYLKNLKREGKAKTEAIKGASKKALKRLSVYAFFFLVASGLGTFGFVKANAWLDTNQIVVKLPVEISYKTNEPVTIVKRVVAVTVSSEQAKIDAIVAEEDNQDLAKYICDKFGAVECKTALAVAKAEGLNHAEGDWSLNTNGTIDVGYFRINSTHFNQAGCSLSEVSTAKGNVDCAYSIYLASGWNPWVAFTSGSYMSRL